VKVRCRAKKWTPSNAAVFILLYNRTGASITLYIDNESNKHSQQGATLKRI